jgi:hypothetical protein
MTPETLKMMSIAVTTNGSGAASQDSPDKINGEILKLIYDKGTINGATTVITKCKQSLTGSVQEQIDSYDINGGSAIRYPCVALQGASAGDNKWTRFAVNDYLTISVSGGAASKTFTVTVLYR